LKAKIGSISPFLLLLGSDIRTWPSPDSDFTRFRTLDSSDLVKVVNSVSPQLLSSKFATLYDTVRGDRTKSITRVRLLTGLIRSCCSEFLIDQNAEFYPTRMWLQATGFQSKTHHQLFYTRHFNERTVVMLELDTLFSILTNSQYLKLFRLSKKQRRYICHHCCHDAELENSGLAPADVRTATLVDGSDAVFCHLCHQTHPVRRVACLDPSCKSNVISADEDFPDLCHLCGEEQGYC
jgi:hypothetical protein